MRRISAFFEMHRFVDPNPCHEINFVKRLASLAVPVYMIQPSPEVPASVAYPKERVLDFVYGYMEDLAGRKRPARFNPNDFGSSLSWMLALAIVELSTEPGQNEIGLYGVDMAADEEYGSQKDGCLSLIHVAKSIGIRITVPAESDLLRPAPLYGYCEHDHSYIKHVEREREINGRLADSRRRMQSALEETRFLEGALNINTYEQRTWIGDGQQLRIMYSQPDPVVENGAAQAALPAPDASAQEYTDRVSRAAAALGMPIPPAHVVQSIDDIVTKIADQERVALGLPPQEAAECDAEREIAIATRRHCGNDSHLLSDETSALSPGAE
jgi:hypothetical protein